MDDRVIAKKTVELKDNVIHQYQIPGQHWGELIPLYIVKYEDRMSERYKKEIESNKKGVARFPTEGVEKMLQGLSPYFTGVP